MTDFVTTYLASLGGLLAELWWTFLLGFLIAGTVEVFVPRERVVRHLGGNDPASLGWATGAGLIASLCTCGAIPLAVKLREKGASTASALTFLMAAPWAGFLQVLVFARFLGWPRALVLFAAALTVAYATGLVLALLERRGLIEGPIAPAHPEAALEDACGGERCGCHAEPSAAPPFAARLRRVPAEAWEAFRELWKYLTAGLLLAAAVAAFVPTAWVVRFLGPENPWAILAAVPVAAAVELCSEGFSVFAGQLSRMGATFPVVFVVVMVGVATDFTEISVVWGKFGRRSAFAYLAVGTALTLAAATLLAGVMSNAG